MRCVSIGRVVSTHGLKGEVKFWYYNENKEEFYRYSSFLFQDGNKWTGLTPERIRLQKGFFFIKFQDRDCIEKVSPLINLELFVREEDLPLLDSDEYYEYQLIGLDVVNQADELIGKLVSIIHTKANDIMVVKGKREVLIPMVDTYIISIDLKESSIKVSGEPFLV